MSKTKCLDAKCVYLLYVSNWLYLYSCLANIMVYWDWQRDIHTVRLTDRCQRDSDMDTKILGSRADWYIKLIQNISAKIR